MKKEPAMKKSIAILLLLASLLCLLASCKDAPPSHTQSPETLPPRDEAPTDNLPAKDMNHFELCFMVNGSSCVRFPAKSDPDLQGKASENPFRK